MHLRGKRLAWLVVPVIAVVAVAAAIWPRWTPADDGRRSALATAGAGRGSGEVTGLGAPTGSGAAATEPPTAAPGDAGASLDPSARPTISPTTAPPVAPTTAATAAAPTAGPTAPPATPGATPRPPTSPPSTPAPPPTTAPPTPAPPTAAPGGTPPPLSACAVFPSTNVWNRRVDGLPVAANSATMIAAIGLGASLHPDFSDAGGYGIPFNIVGAATPRSTVSFQYDDESDHVGYPIPAAPLIESGSDRHLLMVDTDACVLYELFAASKSGSSWSAGSGAVWNLGSNALRPAGWTSADAAGLPILPGLVRYPEVAAGVIRHAIRFTAPQTCDGYVYPARHEAGSGSCATRPPMGLRVRLKSSVDISGFGPQSRVILVALQQYGMLLADNGSPWYITGAPDSRWDDDELHDLGQLEGSDFEVVDTTGFVNG